MQNTGSSSGSSGNSGWDRRMRAPATFNPKLAHCGADGQSRHPAIPPVDAGPQGSAFAPTKDAIARRVCRTQEDTMAKVAFLGLGVMGYPMAGHLAKKGGHEVTVYNRTAAKAAAWVKEYGGRSAATPKAAAEGQDFVMCCVGNDNDLREVTLGT